MHQLLGWSQGQITPSQHQAVTWSRRVGRGGREPGRRISPAPLPPRILWSRLPIFRRNPKHNSPPSSQTATGSVPDRSSLPRVCLEAGLSSAEMAPSAASKNETKGRGSGWEDDSLKIFFLPLFFFPSVSFPFLLLFLLLFQPEQGGWMASQREWQSSPCKEGTGGGLGHLGKMLNILYIFPCATKNR